jgi:hypothetical protein
MTIASHHLRKAFNPLRRVKTRSIELSLPCLRHVRNHFLRGTASARITDEGLIEDRQGTILTVPNKRNLRTKESWAPRVTAPVKPSFKSACPSISANPRSSTWHGYKGTDAATCTCDESTGGAVSRLQRTKAANLARNWFLGFVPNLDPLFSYTLRVRSVNFCCARHSAHPREGFRRFQTIWNPYHFSQGQGARMEKVLCIDAIHCIQGTGGPCLAW